MIRNIINWFRYHRIEDVTDFVEVGLLGLCLVVSVGCMVYLLATLAGHIVGCL